MPALGLGVGLPFPLVAGDSTPGGAADVWALEDDLFGWLLEDGSSFWLIET